MSRLPASPNYAQARFSAASLGIMRRLQYEVSACSQDVPVVIHDQCLFLWRGVFAIGETYIWAPYLSTILFSTHQLSMSRASPSTTSSTSFETIFRDALEAYNKQTKKDIASHPLAVQLKSCGTPTAILDLLRAQVQVFDQSQCADEKLTTWLVPTVNVLHAFSATLGNVVGLVSDSLSHSSSTF
jgi:hypothetical protein